MPRRHICAPSSTWGILTSFTDKLGHNGMIRVSVSNAILGHPRAPSATCRQSIRDTQEGPFPQELSIIGFQSLVPAPGVPRMLDTDHRGSPDTSPHIFAPPNHNVSSRRQYFRLAVVWH